MALVLGHCRYFCEQLNEVRQVVTEEFGAYDKVLAGVVGLQVCAEELGFALYAEGGSALGVLLQQCLSISVSMPTKCVILPTLNAYRSKPVLRPGIGWYLVPAFDTSANVAVGPG